MSARGSARLRLLAFVVLLVVAILVARRIFRSAEARLGDALEDARDALVEGRDDDVLAMLLPDLRYRGIGGIEDAKRDLARFRGAGIGGVSIVRRDLRVVEREGETQGDVRLEVVLSSGLQPLGRVDVSIVATLRDGAWRIASLTWR